MSRAEYLLEIEAYGPLVYLLTKASSGYLWRCSWGCEWCDRDRVPRRRWMHDNAQSTTVQQSMASLLTFRERGIARYWEKEGDFGHALLAKPFQIDLSGIADTGKKPKSKLSSEHPHIWEQAVKMASQLTGYVYPERTEYYGGCGGQGGSEVRGIVYVPDGAMEWLLHEVGHWVVSTPSERAGPNYGLGSEKTGLGFEREWQAWGFQEIIMAPFGASRSFAPPGQRDGVAFDHNGPVPDWATRHAHRELIAAGVDIEEWRSLYAEWIQWGRALGTGKAPWEALQ